MSSRKSVYCVIEGVVFAGQSSMRIPGTAKERVVDDPKAIKYFTEEERKAASYALWVIAGRVPGQWWDVWATGNNNSEYWLGKIEADTESDAVKKARRYWPKFAGRMALEKLKYIPFSSKSKDKIHSESKASRESSSLSNKKNPQRN